MTNPFVVHCDDSWSAEYFILDDHAAGNIDPALQGYKIADMNISLDVYVRTDCTSMAYMRLAAYQNEIAQARTGPNRYVRKNDAMLSLLQSWSFQH